MTFSYQAPDRWSPLPEELFAAIAPTDSQEARACWAVWLAPSMPRTASRPRS